MPTSCSSSAVISAVTAAASSRVSGRLVSPRAGSQCDGPVDPGRGRPSCRPSRRAPSAPVRESVDSSDLHGAVRAADRERVDEQRLGQAPAALVLRGGEPGDERRRAVLAQLHPGRWRRPRRRGSTTTRRFHGSKPGRPVDLRLASPRRSARSRTDHSRNASSCDGPALPGTPSGRPRGRRTPRAASRSGTVGALGQLEHPALPADAVAERLEQPVAGRALRAPACRSRRRPCRGRCPASSARARCRCPRPR